MTELPHDPSAPRALRLVDVSADGSLLVLRGDDDMRYTVEIDEALIAAVRNDRPRLGQLQIDTGELRPRDIQARIRAGASVEQVAASSGLAPERIRRYAGPVLDERRHVVDQARAAGLRGGALESSGHGLGQIVADHLEARGVDTSSLGWDAWRREDARWDVTVTYPAGEAHGGSGRQLMTARFIFDAATRFVVADDDQSRWLLGREAEGSAAADDLLLDLDSPVRQPGRASHLSAVADPAAAEPALTEAPAPNEDSDAGALTSRSGGPAPGGRLAARPRRGARRQKKAEPVQAPSRTDQPAAAPPPAAAQTAPEGRPRAAVPSWDEILFGATSKPDR